MLFSAVALTIVAAAISSTSASAVSPRALVSLNLASSSLLSRQVGTTCVSTCTPVQNQVTACGQDPSCLCAPSLASALSDCANCQVQGDPSMRSQLETAWNQYSSGCASLGRPVSGGLTDGNNATPSVIFTPTTTTAPLAFTTAPIVTSAAAAASSPAPAVFTKSATTSSGISGTSSDTGGLVAHASSASTIRVGGALGLFVAGVAAALL